MNQYINQVRLGLAFLPSNFQARQFLYSCAIIKVMTNEFHHVTLLAVDSDIKPDGIYVDATLGGARTFVLSLSQLSEKGHLYCFDQDQAVCAQYASRTILTREW